MAAYPHTHLLAIGISHRTATSPLRERLFAHEPDSAAVLATAREAGLSHGMTLATCERLEVWSATDPATVAPLRLPDVFGRLAGVEAGLHNQAYSHRGIDALRHIFAVTASLDSQVVGEPHILGQVKESHRQAAAAGMIDPDLDTVLQAAYGAAKRVRGETPLAQRPVSIAASAMLVARDVHGELARRTALLIGLGEMGEFLATDFRAAGIGDLVIVHPSTERSEAAARRYGSHFRPWADLGQALSSADIVVSAMGTGQYSVTAADAEAALKRRRREAILFIDAALPADIDPAVGRLDGAYVFDLADLERVARQGKATREAAADAAWRIVNEDIAAFEQRCAERGAGPAVVALRRRFEDMRAEVLADPRLDTDEATRRLLNRLLHDPSEVLRQAAAQADGKSKKELEAVLRRLFRLDQDGGKEN